MDKRSRRRFTKEFKADTVALVRQSGKSIAEICRDMGLSESSVHRWLAQAEIDAGRRDGLTTAERDELSHLRRESRVVREERDVLAKAIASFTKGADPVSRHRFIAEEKAHHSVGLLCRVLHVPRAGFTRGRHSSRLPELARRPPYQRDQS